MQRTLKSAITISALSALVSAPILLSAGDASAQPIGIPRTGTDANYVGAGVSAGLTGSDEESSTFGGNIQGRFAVPRTPVSVRGAVLFSDENSAIMPIISYDIPVAPNTNAYVGAGYSFVENNGEPTPLGNQDAAVLTAGAETQVGQNFIFYGDTKLGINAYEDSSTPAVSLQGGVGYRF